MRIKNNYRPEVFQYVAKHLAALAPKIDVDIELTTDVFVDLSSNEGAYYHVSDAETGNVCASVSVQGDIEYKDEQLVLFVNYDDHRMNVPLRHTRQVFVLNETKPELIEAVCENIVRFILPFIGRDDIVSQQLNGNFDWTSRTEGSPGQIRQTIFHIRSLSTPSK